MRWSKEDFIEQQIYKGVRRRSAKTFCGLPLVDIAIGPDLKNSELQGHARGIIAIGDTANGWIAIGGVAKGGLAIGGIAIGGGAIGIVAIGGGALGYYALGGGAFGKYAISIMQRSPEAVEFFKHWLPFLPLK